MYFSNAHIEGLNCNKPQDYGGETIILQNINLIF